MSTFFLHIVCIVIGVNRLCYHQGSLSHAVSMSAFRSFGGDLVGINSQAQAVAAAAAGGVAADRENSEQRGPDGYIPRPAKNASASASSSTPATAAAAPPAGGVARLRKAISRQESQGRTSRPKMASDDEAEAAAEFRGEGDRKSEIPA